MSQDHCDDENEEMKYEAYMQAGELAVQVEGETSEAAQEAAMDLWKKAIKDIDEMPEDERSSIGLR